MAAPSLLHIVRSVLLLLPLIFSRKQNGNPIHIVRSVLLLLPLIYNTVAKKWLTVRSQKNGVNPSLPHLLHIVRSVLPLLSLIFSCKTKWRPTPLSSPHCMVVVGGNGSRSHFLMFYAGIYGTALGSNGGISQQQYYCKNEPDKSQKLSGRFYAFRYFDTFFLGGGGRALNKVTAFQTIL